MYRNKLLFIIMIFAGTLAFIKCSKESLPIYNEHQLGSSIYFAENYTGKTVTSQNISFGYMASDVLDSLINIPVYATGLASDSDRTYSVKIADTSTMVEGSDFDFFQPPVIRAGRVTDTLKIILHRTARLKDSTLHLNIQLQPNNDFNTAIGYYYISSIDSVSLLNYNVTANDIAGTAALWTGQIGTIVVLYLGTYSLAKVQLMMTVLQLPAATFFDKNTVISPGYLLGWASYMKTWLATEKAAGRIYYDEFGNEITMGPYA